MTLLVGNDALSGGTSYAPSGGVCFNDVAIAAVRSGTGTHIVIPNIISLGTVTSARAAVFDDAGNLLAATAAFTPTTGENRVALESSVVITEEDEYHLGIMVDTGELQISGDASTWAIAYRSTTFPTIPDPVLPETYLANNSVPNIYVDGTTGTSPATLSDPTPSGTLGTQTTATIGCTTDQNTGTLYVVVDSAANMAGITDAQIIAGTNANDATPVFDGSAAISTTSPSVGATDLVANTAYAYAIVQVNDNGESNVVSGTFTTAEEAAQEVDGDGNFSVALSTAQAGTGQAAARKLRLTEVNELELRSETGALITASGVNFEWYDKFGNTTGEPDVTGSFDVVDGEAVVPLFGSVLDEGQPGTLILYHPSLNTVNGLYRLLVE